METENRSNEQLPSRCRLILAVPALDGAVRLVSEALGGGDVASVIVLRGELDAAAYQLQVRQIVEASKEFHAAILCENDSQVMGRSGADGMIVKGSIGALKEAVARFSPKRIVGYGNVKNRHQAMEAAEAEPDFVFLGRLDGDIRPEPHPKNLGLGEWCASVMQVPIVTMGGSALESALEVARTGVDFVVMGNGIFSHVEATGAAVRWINEQLDSHAPRFEDKNSM